MYRKAPVILTLPDSQSAVSWRIEYPADIADGIPEYAYETISAETIPAGTEHLIWIARGVNLPVFASPVFDLSSASSKSESRQLYGGFPAAAVYPADIDGGRLALDWEDGFACRLLQSCLLNSDAVCAFDTVSFREAVSNKAAEIAADAADAEGGVLPGGCWLLDPVPIASRLGYGLFRESSIRQAEVMAFDIPASAGLWYSDNPLYPPVSVDGAGTLSVTVPLGRRTVFMQPESGSAVTVYFDDGMWCWRNSGTGEVKSGKM